MRKTYGYILKVLVFLLVLTVFSVLNPFDTAIAEGATAYTVVKGDTLWDISIKFGTSVDEIMNTNNMNSDFLQVGQTLNIPGNGFYVQNRSTATPSANPRRYTVVKGDTLWAISIMFGTSIDLIKSANNMNSDFLQIGQVLVIPGYPNQDVSRGSSRPAVQPAVPALNKANCGELVSWWTVDGLFPRGSTAILQDFRTGRQFKIYRLFGTNHADCEPLTAEDSAIMKSCFGGQWNWDRRPAIIYLNGRAIACSMVGMPHGYSQDIYGNDFDGHFCVHFINSRTHGTNSIDPAHQAAVHEAAAGQ